MSSIFPHPHRHFLSAIALITGSVLLFLLNIHRWRLKQRKLSRRLALARMKSNKSELEEEDPVSEHPEPGSFHKPERRPSFPEDEDEEELLVGGVSFQKLEENGELGELEYDMMGDMEDHLEYEMIDNITSCNVVDNYLMLDEYEQNLCKVNFMLTQIKFLHLTLFDMGLKISGRLY